MREAIILAGGLGTRLRHLVPDLPKALAPVAGHPFLHYLMTYLLEQNVDHFIFSIGYKKEAIIGFIQNNFQHLKCSFVEEDSPLGTGGAIKSALKYTSEDLVFVLNADTYFPISLNYFESECRRNKFQISIASKLMEKPYRYGTLDVDHYQRVLQFKEKAEISSGFINAGVYALRTNLFEEEKMPEVFSFEKDVLEKKLDLFSIGSSKFEEFFIDIGIEEDFIRAQSLFTNMDINSKNKRALFLDRDGVINTLIPNDYVKTWSEFKFCDDVFLHLADFTKRFDFVFVITNQQCIGKKIITSDTLDRIHDMMLIELKSVGVILNKIYYCPHVTAENCDCRKPKTGMLKQAVVDFGPFDIQNSVFIGDSDSDIQAAKEFGLISIGKRHDKNHDAFIKTNPNYVIENFSSLKTIAKEIKI